LLLRLRRSWDREGVSKYLKKTYTLTNGAKTEGDGVLQLNIPEEETKCKQATHGTSSNDFIDW
jgi:hypothetical protein